MLFKNELLAVPGDLSVNGPFVPMINEQVTG
jgi:hypothetical protein